MAKKATSLAPAPASGPESVELDPNMTFEQAYAELERLVAELESGEQPLEQSLALHGRGKALAGFCAAKLEAAELKIKSVDDPSDAAPASPDEDA